MQRKIKLGDKVKLIENVKQNTIAGEELFLKGTIGIVCDIDNPDCPCVELENSKGEYTWSGFEIKYLEIID